MDPLDYMVEDCWLHLFNFLSAEDKHSLGQTCETFHAMLQPQKTKWAFGLIFHHISKYLRYGPGGYIGRRQLLRFNLQFRLVCKSWKASFDKPCAVCGFNFCIKHSTIRKKYNFRNVSKLEKFLNFFKDHRGNPFIGRRVKIYATFTGEENLKDLKEAEEPEVKKEDSMGEEDEMEEIDEDEDEQEERANQRWQAENERRRREKRERSLKYRQLLIELLLRYGEEIEHLKLTNRFHSFQFESCSQLDACKFLQLVLSNTPNLQVLELNLRPYYTQEESTFQTALEEYFELNPLPKTLTLRELTLKQNNPMVETILLEAYGEHLQTLRTNNSVEIPLEIWGNMERLKSLRLRHSDFASNEKILQALHSPLESLVIYEKFRYMMNPAHRQFLVDKFLLAVQHLPLKKVMVHSASNIVKESVPFTADFPKHFTITEFTLQQVRSTSLKFLPFLPNLEKLVVGQNEFPYPNANVVPNMN